MRRVGSGRMGAAALLLALLPGAHGAAQSGGVAPPPDHWSYDFLEALDAAGMASAWMVAVRPASREAVRGELSRVAGHDFGGGRVVDLWSNVFDGDHPRLFEAGARGWSGEVAADVGLREGDALLNPGGGAYGLARVLASPSAWSAVWIEGGEGGGERLDVSFRPGAALRLGPFTLMASRQRIKAAGPASTSSQLGGEVPLDAVYLVSERPVTPPRIFALFTGATSWQFVVAPWPDAESSGGGWFGSGGVVMEPHPRFRYGITRSARMGGEGLPGVTAERLARTFLMRNNEPEEWDDQRVEFFARLRWSLFGYPLATHVVLAQEDSPMWKDPGVLTGVLVPVVREEGLYSVRYEYSAYGKRAMWCTWCEYARGQQTHRFQGEWYEHAGVGDFRAEGIPAGDPLGGYGAGHELELSFWSSRRPVRARVWGFARVREEANTLHDRWPGKRRGGGVELSWHPVVGGVVTVGSMVGGGPRIDTDWGGWIRVEAIRPW